MEMLADRYVRLKAEMQTLGVGDALSAAADAVGSVLPPHDVVLVSTSIEGAGVAAVCAARRGDRTRWMKVELLAPESVPDGANVVVVEPVDAGAAWRQAVERVYPGATILVVSDLFAPAAIAA